MLINKLPTKWNQITIEQFLELRNLEKSDGVFSYQIDLICTLLDVYPEEFDDITIQELDEYISKIKFINSEPPKQYLSEFDKFKLKPLSKLTLGEFISLESYFSDDYVKKLPNIIAILYRRFRVNEWGDNTLEPYNYNSNDRLDWFLDFPITHVYGILPEYMKFRESIIDQYQNLMDETEQDDYEETEQLDAEERKAIDDEKRQKKWAWEQLIWSLCQEDLTKFNAVCELPLILVFNFLGMKKELNI